MILLSAAIALAAPADNAPRLFYSKSFPGSTPAYMEIRVERDGRVEYKEAADDDQPVRFKLAEPEVNDMFSLAEKLDHFKRALESGLPVAKMGEKTFRFESGAEKREVKFNYSLDESARLLQDWFEKMTETVLHRSALERAVRYDKLGVNKVLLQLQITMERNRLAGGEMLLGFLDRVRNNDTYLNMARERAAAIADAIRNPKSKAEP
ncbi:MAG: hypothetical protein ACRD44_09030 [Bryobacteraceae bacterium]